MQGGAKGWDQFAKEWAIVNRIQHFECKPDWNKYGLAAGPIRNARMLEWKPDYVIAGPGGRGTADMIRQAVAAGVKVIRCNGGQ